MILTIDGPAGTGKSSVAQRVARALGLDFLDTGAMYRAVALKAVESGVDPSDPSAAPSIACRSTISFDFSASPPRLLLDGVDVSDRLRTPHVSAAASRIAVHPAVRAHLVECQRCIGMEHPNLVTEGRDQGTVVFPHARCKFFLTATAEERARRRVDQLHQMGQNVDPAQVLAEIRERDHRDTTRATSPLVPAGDAIVVDTTKLTLDEVVEHIVQCVMHYREQRHAAAQA